MTICVCVCLEDNLLLKHENPKNESRLIDMSVLSLYLWSFLQNNSLSNLSMLSYTGRIYQIIFL